MNNQRSDIINNFGDSITNIIEGKNFLYYTKGHHGHIWSLAVPEKSHFIIVSGNTRNHDCHIDTISIKESVLKWGLDTLGLYCHKMQPVASSTYWTFHERLVLFSSQKEIIFDCTDTNTYSGTDSVTFNKKNKNSIRTNGEAEFITPCDAIKATSPPSRTWSMALRNK